MPEVRNKVKWDNWHPEWLRLDPDAREVFEYWQVRTGNEDRGIFKAAHRLIRRRLQRHSVEELKRVIDCAASNPKIRSIEPIYLFRKAGKIPQILGDCEHLNGERKLWNDMQT